MDQNCRSNDFTVSTNNGCRILIKVSDIISTRHALLMSLSSREERELEGEEKEKYVFDVVSI